MDHSLPRDSFIATAKTPACNVPCDESQAFSFRGREFVSKKGGRGWGDYFLYYWTEHKSLPYIKV